ncbi:hypothetical protein [Halorubellus sp. PRR65]|uniref:hypothetical protein n=1 Tax=Halorubellus sp. PRR65 TaxID=3098148 RepID=UPI002B2618B7|nr:hypothetical protein [Halorubellus sp. PRR65]
MVRHEFARLALAMGVLGALIGILEPETYLFEGTVVPAVVQIAAGLLVLAGTGVYTVGWWQEYAATGS